MSVVKQARYRPWASCPHQSLRNRQRGSAPLIGIQAAFPVAPLRVLPQKPKLANPLAAKHWFMITIPIILPTYRKTKNIAVRTDRVHDVDSVCLRHAKTRCLSHVASGYVMPRPRDCQPPARVCTKASAHCLGQCPHPPDIGLPFGDRNHAARVQQVKDVAGLDALIIGRMRHDDALAGLWGPHARLLKDWRTRPRPLRSGATTRRCWPVSKFQRAYSSSVCLNTSP